VNTPRLLRGVCVWTLLFLISAGLGYPTLNRYDPRVAIPDAAIYAQMAVHGPSAVNTPLGFRVLVPAMAGSVFLVVRNHTGSWDPLMFSFLGVNAFFVATTGYLLFRIGRDIVPEASVALLAATLYLLNFAIANLHLAALVDAAEACLLMAVVASMFYQRWYLLPLWGVIGALAKESFVPFSISMFLAWWIASRERNPKHAIWIVITTAAELTTFVMVHWLVSGHRVAPWTAAVDMRSSTSYLGNLWNSLVDRNSWYILIWLLPLGLAGEKGMPREWKAAAAVGVVVAIVLNAYHSTVGGGGAGLGRYVFNIAGPQLNLAAAGFLANVQSKKPATDVRPVSTRRS
jgi:hypothetical protein